MTPIYINLPKSMIQKKIHEGRTASVELYTKTNSLSMCRVRKPCSVLHSATMSTQETEQNVDSWLPAGVRRLLGGNTDSLKAVVSGRKTGSATLPVYLLSTSYSSFWVGLRPWRDTERQGQGKLKFCVPLNCNNGQVWQISTIRWPEFREQIWGHLWSLIQQDIFQNLTDIMWPPLCLWTPLTSIKTRKLGGWSSITDLT